MPLSIRIRVYIVTVLLGTYMAYSVFLIDQFHVSRFIWVGIVNILGLFFILPKLKLIRLHIFDGLLFAFYGLHLLSLSWSLNFAEAIFTAQKGLLLFLSYFLFRLIIEKHKKADKWITYTVLSLSLFVLTITSIYVVQLAIEKGLGGKAIYDLQVLSGHKNLVVSYIFFLFCYLISKASFIKEKKLLFFTLIWQFLLILLFRSRAVYLGLASFLLIGGAYYVWSNSVHRKLIFHKILPAFIVLSSLAVLVANKTETGKVYLKYLNPTTYQTSASAVERQFVWYKTRELIKDNPLLGCGSGNWKLLFPSKSIEGGFRLQEKGLVFTRVHNDFLEIWAEVGLIGFLLYLCLFLVSFTALFLSARKTSDKEKKRKLVLLGASLVGYCIVAFFDFPKERIEHQVFLALLFATIMVESKDILQITWPSIKVNKVQKTILIGVLLICWLPNIPIGWARVLGDHHMKDILTATDKNDSNQIKLLCKKIPDIWYTVDPLTLPIKWYEGLGYYFDKDYIAALSRFEDAYAVNPHNFHVLNNYASVLVQLKRYKEAIPYFKKSLIINPTFESGIFNLSFAYFNIGEFDEALNWVNKITKNTKKKALFIEQIEARAKAQN